MFTVNEKRPSRRRKRADAGKPRLDPALQAKLSELWSSSERPRITDVQRALAEFCRQSALRMPSRAALYRYRALLPPASYPYQDLPNAVQQSLYNLDAGANIPGEQVVFYAFNYGTTAAMSFAAALPLNCLERAERLRGWRPKSLSLLRSVLIYRKT